MSTEELGSILLDNSCTVSLHKFYMPVDATAFAAVCNSMSRRYPNAMLLAKGGILWEVFAPNPVGHRITPKERDQLYETHYQAKVDCAFEMIKSDFPPEKHAEIRGNLERNMRG